MLRQKAGNAVEQCAISSSDTSSLGKDCKKINKQETKAGKQIEVRIYIDGILLGETDAGLSHCGMPPKDGTRNFD